MSESDVPAGESDASIEPRYTRDELIAELGLSQEFAQKIWNAFGFARRTTGEKIFTEADLAALRVFAAAELTLPEGAQVATARAIGQSIGKLAEWQADQLRALAADPDVPWTVEQMSAALGQVQQLIWRRHLDLALAKDVAQDSDERMELVVGFADIVGYTSLSRSIALDELEALLEEFEDSTFDIVTHAGGQVIKTLGDGVLFTFRDAGAAAAAAIEMHQLTEQGRIPAIRVGLARGPILSRLGDVFGEPVNIAARLAGSARSGTTLVDDAVAEQLGDDSRFYLKSIPPLHVRGYRRLRGRALEPNRRHDPDQSPPDDAPTP